MISNDASILALKKQLFYEISIAKKNMIDMQRVMTTGELVLLAVSKGKRRG